MPVTATSSYRARNTEQTKQIVIAVKVAGLDDVLVNTAVSTPLAYGGGAIYGDAGVVYGGTTYGQGPDSVAIFRQILSVEKSSMQIAQKLEPEQGRASVSTLSLAFIDKNQFMTQLISPGILIPDILGCAVEVFLGYQGLTYPDDYLRVFRGYVSNYSSQAGLVTLQLSDPNSRRRQQIFTNAKTTLSQPIAATGDVSTINVVGTGDFYTPILGPNGTTDLGVEFFVQIDDEFFSYTDAASASFTGSVRGQLGSAFEAHDGPSGSNLGADVTGYIQLTDHCIDMALKLMLSGWNGPYETNVPITAFGEVPGVGFVENMIVLPPNVDAVMDYGLSAGDYITSTGATNGANDQTVTVVGFTNIGGQMNRGIRTSGTFVSEDASPAALAFRSQFDTYPVDAGMKLSPKDVDVAGHLAIKQTFLGSSDYSYRFLIGSANSSGKTFIESQIYLPYGLYSLTKRGLLAVGLTKPPVGGATLPVLTQDNVLNPESIVVTRGTNNRKFFNEIDVSYDLDTDGQTYGSNFFFINSDSLEIISAGTPTVLPIQSDGARSEFNAEDILTKQARLLLTRYGSGAVQITCKVNWGIGNLIEAGDIVAVQDFGGLQISNLLTGERGLGIQLFEVQDRKLDIATGNIQLQLISGVGGSPSDRYGVISPSSLISSATTTQITIEDSFGAVFPGAEGDKWTSYIGQRVIIHNEDYSVSEETTLFSQDPIDTYTFTLNPPLSSPPPSGYILDVPAYPTSVDPETNLIYKSTFAFWDPQVAVTSGTSNTQFDVSPSDASKFFEGSIIRVHNADFSVDSGDVSVDSVSGSTITTATSLEFTPSAGYLVDLIGFPDEGAAYRWI